MELIFNKKIVKKWNLWVRKQYIDALFTVEKSTNVSRTRKRRRENRRTKM